MKNEKAIELKHIAIWICQACLDGKGQECHTPGCALYLHTVSLPIAPEMYELLREPFIPAFVKTPEKPCLECGGSKWLWTNFGKVGPHKETCPKCDYRLIKLTNDKYAIVDVEDYNRINKFKWRIDEKGRACRNAWVNGKQQNIKMHRFIMDTPKGMLTDHIDYNLLNNRKYNLRICTSAQSMAHRRTIPNTSSKYKGVSWCSERNKWSAQIKHNYKGKWLGRYETEIEAARAYDTKAKELFGEYAELNFPKKCKPDVAEFTWPKIFRICQNCHVEYTLVFRQAFGIGGFNTTFGDCPHCGKRDDTWLRILPAGIIESLEAKDE